MSNESYDELVSEGESLGVIAEAELVRGNITLTDRNIPLTVVAQNSPELIAEVVANDRANGLARQSPIESVYDSLATRKHGVPRLLTSIALGITLGTGITVAVGAEKYDMAANQGVYLPTKIPGNALSYSDRYMPVMVSKNIYTGKTSEDGLIPSLIIGAGGLLGFGGGVIANQNLSPQGIRRRAQQELNQIPITPER